MIVTINKMFNGIKWLFRAGPADARPVSQLRFQIGITLGFVCATVFNYLASVKFDKSPGEVASYIVLSTVVILLLLPLIVPVSWWMAGMTGSTP